MLELATDFQAWVSLLTLTILEIVLGIDNVVFISVVVSKLPHKQAVRARQIGIALALGFRIALLMVLVWIIGLTEPVFSIFGEEFSWRDIILLAGGLFLLYKATQEIHQNIEGDHEAHLGGKKSGFAAVIVQVIIIDMVFSVDSIVTAIGIAEHVEIMILAVVISMIVMYLASGAIAAFIRENPTTKMLALAFLLLIGLALVADGLGFHIPRGYIYFSMLFAGMVEMFNILAHKRRIRAHSQSRN